ncbi:vWA domain-containing protein [Streptomyces apocyni]|uniref:vWA domain-containing protein n=1 Tax=Streptomyces apocyni TaxID=2654677 RepID=UPI0012EAA9B4|nr:von Willebrand factor type A domain-containing protein [Streptomyces apocyni]
MGYQERTRARGRRMRGSLVAGALAAVMLVSGCSGAGDNSANRGSDKRGGSGPGPAPAQPTDGGPAPESGQDGAERDIAPSPDYLSTFALDVDTASYGYARRSLSEGRLPEPSTVRAEEFVNSFRQGYPQPKGNGISVSVDGARLGGGEGEGKGEGDWSLVRVGLATKSASKSGARPPAVLTFVIDVSGSMAEPGRLDLVRRSLKTMTGQLRRDDSVALVTFDDKARTVLPMTRIGSGRDEVQRAIRELETGGSTNLDAGVRTGYGQAVDGRRPGATNRVVILSDALANTGETHADAILERIGKARKRHGITLFGVGVGSQYGDALMERLTNKGDGHTAYVADDESARKVFVEQLPTNVELRARDAKAQVAFDPETVEEFRLIGYDNRRVADEDFRDDRVDGGEVGPGHTVTALYAVRLKGKGGDGHVATATVRWLDPRTRAPHEESARIEAGALDGRLWGGADRRFQVAAVAAYFADALRSAGGGSGGSYQPKNGGSVYDEGPGSSAYDGEPGPPSGSLPGAMPLKRLADRASDLADASDEREVRQLADAVRQASKLRD